MGSPGTREQYDRMQWNASRDSFDFDGTFDGYKHLFGDQFGSAAWKIRTSNWNADQEERKRVMQDAMQDTNLDTVSLTELTDFYNKGAGSAYLANKVSDMRSGKGVYASRMQNRAEQNILKATPGIMQISSTVKQNVLGSDKDNLEL